MVLRHASKMACVIAALLFAWSGRAGGQTLADPKLHVREVVSGLSTPTAMAFIGLRDILVLQKNDGRVRRVINGVLQSGAVLDVAVDTASERGLLGIAVHPNFPATPSVYLYYTQSSTSVDTNGSPLANRVYRYTWNGSALVSPQLILDLPVTPGPNHDGGTLTFGPDGKLYVVIGDLNRDGQLQNNVSGAAPDDSGVILRVNDDGSAPADNPFFAQGGNLAKYYAYGVRNSFGLAFDPVSGELWDTENGPANYDEINLVLPGFNSGWRDIMGPDGRDPQSISDLVQIAGSHYGDPKFSWLSTVGPTALVFISSPRLGPGYQNDLFVGDINNGRLYRFRVNSGRDGFVFTDPGLADLVADNGTELQETILGTGFGPAFGGISDLKVGPDGLLYVLSLGLGKIFVISTQAVGADFDGDGKSDIGIERDGLWVIVRSSDGGFTLESLGDFSFSPLPADYDGDGVTDIAARSPVFFGLWWIRRSSDGIISFRGVGETFGAEVQADYDGDGKIDVAVYSHGIWKILHSSSETVTIVGHGGSEWSAVRADYDGDGKADMTVYKDGAWSVLQSSSNTIAVTGHGGPLWTPVPADYDGDGRADIAVYHADGVWSIRRSSDSVITVVGHGGPEWRPVPADYDGDGKTDIAVYHPVGAWSIVQSSTNTIRVVGHGGGPTDVPLN